MTIEFHCPSCGKFLKTSDDKAGASAKCPDCMARITIPDNSAERGQSKVPPIPSQREPSNSSDRFSDYFEGSAVGQSNDPMKSCPYCGETIKAVAIKCRFCGERIENLSPSENRSSQLDDHLDFSRSPEFSSFVSNKVTAGICGILFGGFGVHKFILGLNSAGAIMLVFYLGGLITGFCFLLPLLAPFVFGTIGFIEGIIYLSKSDEDFYQSYAIEKRQWF